MSLESEETTVIATLATEADDETQLLRIFDISRDPSRQEMWAVQEAYQMALYWRAVAYGRRKSNPTRAGASFEEEYLEAAVKGLNSALMTIASLNKAGGY
jgi:creatinine amidohydrolase/Fe(II)-dependent formamide hydrolase-like protein